VKASATVAQKTDLQGVRGHLAQLHEQGRADEALELVMDLLGRLCDENLRLSLEVFKLLKQHSGRRSEGISTEQLDLFLQKLGQTEAGSTDEASAADTEPSAAEAEVDKPPRVRRKKRPKRRKLPVHLPRDETILPVPDEQRRCEEHGEKTPIGYEDSEVLHFKPASFWVEVLRREKLVCRPCEGSIVVAPPANKVVEGGIAGPGLIADLLIGKFRDHLPVNRQLRRYRRLDVKLASSTVSDWIGQGADLLEPLYKLEGELVLQAFLLQTDDTALKVRDRSHPGNIKRGAMWVHVGDFRHCYVIYTPSKEYKDGDNDALEYLKGRKGYIQADAFPGYDTVFEVPGSEAIEVGCWMHGRRYFVTALDSGDLRAAIPLKLIKGMYEVEEQATKARASPEQRLALRKEHSEPKLHELGHWIAEHYQAERPKSPLAKAMGYALNQWDALCRPFEDGRLPLDNGESERRIRDIAMGRRNYLFAGSDTGARRAAIVYSVLGGCVLNDIEPWAYLTDVIQRIVDGWPMAHLAQLLPANYAATLAAEAEAKSALHQTSASVRPASPRLAAHPSR